MWNDTREAPAAAAWAFRLFVRHCRNNIELRVKYERPRGAPPAKPFFRSAAQYQAFSLGLASPTETGHIDSYYSRNPAEYRATYVNRNKILYHLRTLLVHTTVPR